MLNVYVQVKENKGYQLVESDAKVNDQGSKVHPSEIEEIKRGVKCVASSISKSSDSCYLPKSCFADTSAIVSTVQQYPPYILSSPLQNNVEKVVDVDYPKLLSSINSCLQNRGERLALASSAERISFPTYPEEMVDCVDDIEEYQFPLSKDGACLDQMVFQFRSSGLSTREKTQFGCHESDTDQDESQSETSSIRISRRSKRAPGKRSRRRSASLENLGIVDIGYMIYYQKPCRSPSTHKHGRRKHQKLSLEGIPPSNKKELLHSFSEKEIFLQSSQIEDGTKRKSFNLKIRGCSLDQPCYFCIYDDIDCLETLSKKATHVQQGVMLDECCHCQPFWDVELNKGMESVTIPQRPNRKSHSGVAECHAFNYPDCKAGNGNNKMKAEISASPSVSNPRTIGSLTRIETEAPYSRAMTMPQERHRNGKDKMFRTYSCPSQHPNHVHPKLPDYDDIAAKFTALKKEHLENKDCSGRPIEKVEEARTQQH